jgi:hypothetical protein
MGINRYKDLVQSNGNMLSFPKVVISKRDTDKFVLYNSLKTRLDRIAYEIYNDDTYWWVILLANPDYPLEYDIPPNTVIRVPFPIADVVGEINSKISSSKNKS